MKKIICIALSIFFIFTLTSCDNAEEKDGFDSAMLDTAFTPDEVGRIAGMRVLRLRLTDNSVGVFEECVASLKEAVTLERKKDAPPSFDKLNDLLNRKRSQS